MRMLAITLWQPWASLLAAGVADVLNRDWARPGILRPGTWLAIHAGALVDANAIGSAEAGIRSHWRDAPDSVCTLPRRAIIGAVRIEGYGKNRRPNGLAYATCRIRGDNSSCEHRPFCSFWGTGPVCWCLDRAVSLPIPIRCGGDKGLWPVPPDATQALRQAIAGARP